MVVADLTPSERLALERSIAMYKKLDALVLQAPVLSPAAKTLLSRSLRDRFDDTATKEIALECVTVAHELGLDCAAEMLSDFESDYIPFWLTRKNTRHAG